MRNRNPNFSAARTRERMRRNGEGQAAVAMTNNRNLTNVVGISIGGSLALAVLVWDMGPQIQSAVSASMVSPDERARIEASAYYSGCREARAAGVAPLYAGQPGYREGMDGDGDGIACEPHR
jgi:hypothetical protein